MPSTASIFSSLLVLREIEVRSSLKPAGVGAMASVTRPEATTDGPRGASCPNALAALTLAILPVVPGFVRAATTAGGQVAHPTWWDSLYTYAWFVTFALAFLLHLAFGEDSPKVSD